MSNKIYSWTMFRHPVFQHLQTRTAVLYYHENMRHIDTFNQYRYRILPTDMQYAFIDMN